MVKTNNYGATAGDWYNLEIELGLTEDLLPVVSNPLAKISANSKMKEKGKTPSRYNSKREVVGFVKWTGYKATVKDIDTWRKEPDYSACIQSRYARALDFDLKTNHSKVKDFVDKYCLDNFGFVLPIRTRIDSSKYLMIYKLKGEYAKRTVKTASGIIENLNNGQQFLISGTHPEGQRYQLDMRGHIDIPELTPEQYEVLWKAICDKFGIEKPSEGHIRIKSESFAADDEIAQYLDIKGIGKDGQLFVDCPWKNEHTMDGGEAETAYFPPGTGGYALPHFKCFHGHCSHRTDSDFLDALNITDKIIKFEPLLPGVEEILPNFVRTKAGEPLATLDNVCLALEAGCITNKWLRKDSFRDEILISPKEKLDTWNAFTDEDSTAIRRTLEKQGRFKPIGRETMRDAVNLIAKGHSFDSAMFWLSNLPEWDGIPRVNRFMVDYFGTSDDAYSEAVSKYIWTALAGRIMSPGVQADMVPIFEGEEGIRKSSAIAAMVPDRQYFVEISFHESDDSLARRIRGKMIAEIAELRGLHTKEAESILAAVTRTHEDWTPKYKEFNTNYPRRLIFLGTTNATDILDAGRRNRRWLPIHVVRADVEAIKRDRNQLWAEGLLMFQKSGVFWQAEKHSSEAHEGYIKTDTWQEPIFNWLYDKDIDGQTPLDKEYITTYEVLQGAVNLETSKHNPHHSSRVSSILKGMGFKQKTTRINGRGTRVWIKKTTKINNEDLL